MFLQFLLLLFVDGLRAEVTKECESFTHPYQLPIIEKKCYKNEANEMVCGHKLAMNTTNVMATFCFNARRRTVATKTVVERICNDVPDQECQIQTIVQDTPVNSTECKIEKENKCSIVTVPTKEKECRKILEKKCKTVSEVVVEIVEGVDCSKVKENECRTVTETLCEEVSVTRLRRAGERRRDVKCQQVPREECREVEKDVCVPVARPQESVVTKDECWQEPTTQCRLVTRARPQKKCVPVEVQKCRWVVRNFKQEVHEQVCRNITRQECEDVPRTLTRNEGEENEGTEKKIKRGKGKYGKRAGAFLKRNKGTDSEKFAKSARKKVHKFDRAVKKQMRKLQAALTDCYGDDSTKDETEIEEVEIEGETMTFTVSEKYVVMDGVKIKFKDLERDDFKNLLNELGNATDNVTLNVKNIKKRKENGMCSPGRRLETFSARRDRNFAVQVNELDA